jgi:hypothetical protein
MCKAAYSQMQELSSVGFHRRFSTALLSRLQPRVVLPRQLLRRACCSVIPLLCCPPPQLNVHADVPQNLRRRSSVLKPSSRSSLPKPSSGPSLCGCFRYLTFLQSAPSFLPSLRDFRCALPDCGLPGCDLPSYALPGYVIQDKNFLALQA